MVAAQWHHCLALPSQPFTAQPFTARPVVRPTMACLSCLSCAHNDDGDNPRPAGIFSAAFLPAVGPWNGFCVGVGISW